MSEVDHDGSIRFTLPLPTGGQQTNSQPSSLYLPVLGQQRLASLSLQLPGMGVSLSQQSQGSLVQARPAYPSDASLIGYDVVTKAPVWFSDAARSRGFYIFGKTGTGKTTLFINLILQDIERGIGVCFVDPVGDAINDLVARIPEEHLHRVVLLDILHPSYTFGLNVYEGATDTPEAITETHERIMHLFRLLWGDKTNNDELGVRVRQYLSNSAFTLIENNARGRGCAMTEIPLLFRNKAARATLTAGVTKQSCRDFWEGYEKLKADEQEERADTQLSRVDAFLGNYYAEQIVGQARTTVDFRRIMNDPTGPIVLIKLSNSHKELSQLVGAVIITNLLEAAKSRVHLAREERQQFNIYADEYHLFATSDWAEMVEQARKFNVCANFGHQRRNQLSYTGKAGALQTVNKAVFRVSGEDAAEVAREFNCAPQPGPPQYEPIKAPVREPIEFIVKNNKGFPSSPVTRRFFEVYGHALVEGAEKEEEAEREYKNAWQRYDTNGSRYAIAPMLPPPTYEYRMLLELLNGLFYAAMQAGKAGESLPDITASEIVASYFIRTCGKYSDAADYLRVRTQYDTLRRTDNRLVADPIVCKWMLDNRYAMLSGYKENKLFWVSWQRIFAERSAVEVYKRALVEELTALRKKIVIVRRGQYYYRPRIIREWDTQEDRYAIRASAQEPPLPNRIKNAHISDIVSFRSDVFLSWYTAVAFYQKAVQEVWAELAYTLSSSQMWLYQPLRVTCSVTDDAGIYTQMDEEEILDGWILRPGVEHTWYTGQTIAEEALVRIESLESQSGTSTVLEGLIDREADVRSALETVRAAVRQARDEYIGVEKKVTEQIGTELAGVETQRTLLLDMLALAPGYHTFVNELNSLLSEVMQELASAPIEADSGLTQEVPTEISSAEVERRIANDLTWLPDLTARTVLHVYDRPVEQTISIPRLRPGVDEDEVRQRLAIIEQYTLTNGYYRERADVQREIQERRAALLNAGLPGQQQQQGQAPVAPPPSSPPSQPPPTPPSSTKKKSRLG